MDVSGWMKVGIGDQNVWDVLAVCLLGVSKVESCRDWSVCLLGVGAENVWDVLAVSKVVCCHFAQDRMCVRLLCFWDLARVCATTMQLASSVALPGTELLPSMLAGVWGTPSVPCASPMFIADLVAAHNIKLKELRKLASSRGLPNAGKRTT